VLEPVGSLVSTYQNENGIFKTGPTVGVTGGKKGRDNRLRGGTPTTRKAASRVFEVSSTALPKRAHNQPVGAFATGLIQLFPPRRQEFAGSQNYLRLLTDSHPRQLLCWPSLQGLAAVVRFTRAELLWWLKGIANVRP